MDECLAYGICGLVIVRTSASGGSDPVRVTDEHDIRICVETAHVSREQHAPVGGNICVSRQIE